MVLQALTDAALGGQHERRDVARWLVTTHFIEVCDAADMQPDRVRSMVRQLMSNQDRQYARWFVARVRERMNS